uniref:Secreted protein n=1 Tax=Pyxicephalus adspersus TaxID=30357 RepID=A0AAV3A8Q6_PYXAD|nr:TPA: hypothetical protein GDO54_014433 [Pyxicephalus adspersus]
MCGGPVSRTSMTDLFCAELLTALTLVNFRCALVFSLRCVFAEQSLKFTVFVASDLTVAVKITFCSETDTLVESFAFPLVLMDVEHKLDAFLIVSLFWTGVPTTTFIPVPACALPSVF